MSATVSNPYASLAEVGGRLRRREITSVEITQQCLERIETIDHKLGAFLTLTADRALRDAEQADRELQRGVDRGPLHGIPIAVKDAFATKEVRTTANSRLYRDFIPTQNAAVVEHLVQGGAVMLGKLTMDELGYGGPVVSDSLTPQPRNPWNLNHVTGGSSSGCGAAVAAGLCFGALGSDSGGSIRGPAAYCGIVGLKPTEGLVSRAGAIPLGLSLGENGPMARTAEDCAVLLKVIAGNGSNKLLPDGAIDATAPAKSVGVTGRRFGVPRDWIDPGNGVSEVVHAAFEESLDVLRTLGARIEDMPSAAFTDARDVCSLITVTEKFALFADHLRSRPQDIGRPLRGKLYAGGLVGAADYITAQRARAILRDRINAVMSPLDGVLLPTVPAPAPLWEPDSDLTATPNLMAVFNLVGLPAVTVPNGVTPDRLPLGLQVAGGRFDDLQILSFASAYESATHWGRQVPTSY